MKVGGVSDVTQSSFEYSRIFSGDGFFPIKFVREPVCPTLSEKLMTGYPNTRKSGRRLLVLSSITLFLKCVPAVEARCPPAEKPIIPTLFGSMFHSFALLRTRAMACCASC